jgi:hypothetical protein
MDAVRKAAVRNAVFQFAVVRSAVVGKGNAALGKLLALVLALVSAGGALASCAPGGVPGEQRLAELERLAFVGAGRSVLAANYPCGVDEPLLVDRFEVTRGRWRAVSGAWPEPGRLNLEIARSDEATRDWPAFATFDEALVWAERRGMRLPTLEEWLFMAAGPSAGFYPWGRQDRASVANTLELGLNRPLPVGCFEQGASWSELYDLYGNVGEWVTGWPPLGAAPSTELRPEEVAYSMGGSFLERTVPLHMRGGGGEQAKELARFAMRPLPRGIRGVELGLRCCIEAEAFLEERYAHGRYPAGAAERFRAIGLAWGNEARTLLEDLLERHPRSTAFKHLLEGASARR